MRISQSVTSSRVEFAKQAQAFTEHGVAMLSGVLRSSKAIAVNIAIMRAFTRVNRLESLQAEPARQIALLRSHVQGHDEQIAAIVESIRRLLAPDRGSSQKIAFNAPRDLLA
jgi:hypothetical protein